MEYPLSISSLIETGREGRSLRSPLTCIMAEADLGPFADFGSPEFFFGHLVADDEIKHFRQASEVEDHFRGAAYRFEALEPTAAFKLVRRS